MNDQHMTAGARGAIFFAALGMLAILVLLLLSSCSPQTPEQREAVGQATATAEAVNGLTLKCFTSAADFRNKWVVDNASLYNTPIQKVVPVYTGGESGRLIGFDIYFQNGTQAHLYGEGVYCLWY